MPKELKLPEFTVHPDFYQTASVRWRDAQRRYHFWITDAGELTDDTLHSNPIDPPGIGQHRALDATSKKWSPLVEAILARVKADDLVAKARAAAKEKAQREADERVRKLQENDLARLHRATAKLPKALADQLLELPACDRLAFVAALDHT